MEEKRGFAAVKQQHNVEMVVCQACNGSGEVDQTVASTGDAKGAFIRFCIPCSGRGKLPQLYPTGKAK
jgi:DnaJ-class molecular chaperone